jgi:flagellar biogenesis protein FliO
MDTGGVFAELLRVLVVLALISAGAFWGLRWLARRGALGPRFPAAEGGLQLKVLARVPLAPRQALYLVQVGERRLLLGTGESGPPCLLVDLGLNDRGAVSGEAQDGA